MKIDLNFLKYKLNAISDNTCNLNKSVGNLATEATLLNVESNAQQVSVNTTGVKRAPGIIRPTGVGDINTIVPTFYSVSVANVGLSNGTILGAVIKPGEVLNFSGDALNNYFISFDYDATGTEFVIIFVY